MAQKTLVLMVPAARQRALRGRLAAGDFEFRQVPHAVFSVKGAGVVATLYRSGKLVVQGADPELFVARYTDLDPGLDAMAAEVAARPPAERIERPGVPTIGSDEAGKGDYFGPLVVAAVLLEPGRASQVAEWGVADSKRLSDLRVLRLGAALRGAVAHAVVALDPPEYNERYGSYASLNPLLADLHAEAIKELARPGVRVVVDQFGSESLMRDALAGVDVELVQMHRAERNLAVAAASVLARQEFLVRLAELSEECGVELPKGAGAQVDAAGRRYAVRYGAEELGRVAKLHFKNTAKVRGRPR